MQHREELASVIGSFAAQDTVDCMDHFSCNGHENLKPGLVMSQECFVEGLHMKGSTTLCSGRDSLTSSY